ncbi:MAG: methionine--tRNA ligase [Euryarchaeota archaeon]|nr:methionine--tRNA ligase [Euryarchaeota archaeon]
MVKWVVTAAWPYINYMPHLGTMIGSMLSADIVARYLRLKGEDIVFVSGSDEHGTPIEVEAVRQGMDPKALTDKNHKKVKELIQKWGISFDNYTRTENEIHKKFVREFYLEVQKNGYIFTEDTELFFCPKCNRFLPDRFVEGKCPHCGYEEARGDQCDECGRLLEAVKLITPYCVICRTTPIPKVTKHWYFDLPKFSEELYNYIVQNENLSENAINFSLNLIKEGLRPRSLTRDSAWGIPAPFPGAEDKTIYVWMEAVLGYISATVEYFQNKGRLDKWKERWLDSSTRTLYFIAKDNIPFHTLIFPALLMAAKKGYVLPWAVNSTEFLMIQGQKFSKSRRIGVWIDEALDMFPTDYWRYVLISIRPETKDASFTWQTFIEKVNSDLNDTIGNFLHRTLVFIYRYFNATVPKPSEFDDYDRQVLELIKTKQKEVASNIEKFKLQAALSTVLEIARVGNKYINDKEPWKTIKTNPEIAANALFVSIQITKALAILLEPFLPFTAEKIWSLLNQPGSIHEQTWEEALNQIPSGHKIMEPTILFNKVDETSIRKMREKLERAQ